MDSSIAIGEHAVVKSRLLLGCSSSATIPTIVEVAGERAQTRFWEFFVSNIRNPHTRRAYARAVQEFFAWCEPVNPAASVRGPKHVVKVGKTPVLDPAEARTLLDAIDVTTPAGLRDRALVGLMVYSFARVGAALAMKVEDVYVQNKGHRTALSVRRPNSFRFARE